MRIDEPSLYWFPIHRDDAGREFTILHEAAACKEAVEFKLDRLHRDIPHWLRDNPVIRIVQMEITLKEVK